jgi:hypothetical protein
MHKITKNTKNTLKTMHNLTVQKNKNTKSPLCKFNGFLHLKESPLFYCVNNRKKTKKEKKEKKKKSYITFS